MEEEMSTYSSIVESKVCNMGFEIDLGFFSKLFPLQGSLQWCCTAVFCTLSVTKPGTPDIHPPDFPVHAVDFSPSHFPEEHVRRQKWKCLPWNRAKVALAPFGTAHVVPVCNVGRGEGCLCSVSSQICFHHFCCSVDKPLWELKENCWLFLPGTPLLPAWH